MNSKLIIKETTKDDLENIMLLWNDGDVMFYVGFPNGLGIALEKLTEWLEWSKAKNNKRKHYSIYHEDIGYCGETFYDILENEYIMVDIKLLPKARSKGIAYDALGYAIDNAFLNGGIIAFVDPHKNNTKALNLYDKLGFKKADIPPFLKKDVDSSHIYMELKKQV